MVAILAFNGWPIFYVSERMKTPSEPFKLYKFRTMSNVDPHLNLGVTGTHKTTRISSLGKRLRKYHLDELPQLFNVIIGDMSFVGPRPPLKQYTDAFPMMYDKVLQSRPGITGFATLHFRNREKELLSRAATPGETEEIYTRHCIPKKVALDLIYHKHASVCFDAMILAQTLFQLLAPKPLGRTKARSGRRPTVTATGISRSAHH